MKMFPPPLLANWQGVSESQGACFPGRIPSPCQDTTVYRKLMAMEIEHSHCASTIYCLKAVHLLI